MRPIVDALLAFEIEDFKEPAQVRRGHNLTEIRDGFRAVLVRQSIVEAAAIFSNKGMDNVRNRLVPAVRQLHGSYYGMIEGIYPVHLISRREIPLRLIREQGEIRCEIRVSDDDQTWEFEPSGIAEDSSEFFRLEFTIPAFVADMLNARTGLIVFRLILDVDWLNRYVQRREALARRGGEVA
jgi:hypothetical protein